MDISKLKSWLMPKLADLSSAGKAWWTKQGPLLPREWLLYVLMLAALVVSLMGCATTSAPSEFTPRNPLPPQLSQSPPSVTYSSGAAADIQSWRKKLMDTLATP